MSALHPFQGTRRFVSVKHGVLKGASSWTNLGIFVRETIETAEGAFSPGPPVHW